MLPDLSVLIVSWNVREHVRECIASIAADAARPHTEVILVDNASADGTAPAIRQEFPWVRVVENAENHGFPAANNQALALARGRHVLFLNPDTVVRPGTLAACVRALDADPDLGAVGCRIEFPDGRIQYEGGRSRYRFRHLVYEVLYLHMLFPRSRIFAEHVMGDWDHRGVRNVDALSGAFMMVPHRVALEVGGLPDDVFMYHEDLSFCMRIGRSGRTLLYRGDVSIVHYGGSSSRRSPARLTLLEVEAKQRFIRDGDGPVWAALARSVFLLRSLVRLAVCTVGSALPRSFRERYPRVFDWRTHALQLAWAVSPALTAGLMPRSGPRPPLRALHEGAP